MSGRWARIWRLRSMARVGMCLCWGAVSLAASLSLARTPQSTAAPAVTSAAETMEPGAPVGAHSAAKVKDNEYIVSPEDLLDVNVMDVPEVSRTYRVSSNGFLTLPLLPAPIAAAGETLDQLSHLIAAKFHDAGMINNAQVMVSLRETRLSTVLVSGEVRNPQAYQLFGPTRLLDVLVRAGGLAPDAGDDVTVARGEAGQRADMAEGAKTGTADPSADGQSFTLNVLKLMQTGAGKSNILLYPGDRVTVQRAELLYILGAVARPGGYVLNETRQHITVLKALALAGDATSVAKKNRMLILRRDPTGPENKRDEIPVNFKAIVKGQIADMPLKPDDILFVPESAKAKAMRSSISTALNVATGTAPWLLIYH